MSYVKLMDECAADKKKSLTGQMSLFDFAGEEEKKEYDIDLPQVSEYVKDELLAFEKEVLGVYISGHPLEAYEDRIKKNVTSNSNDYLIDEETGKTKVEDGNTELIGGMITGKTIKNTRNNSIMAFVTLEDMFGIVEIIFFPKDYEKYKNMLETDQKVFIRGKVTAEEDKPAKLICQELIPFDSIPVELWIKFPSISDYKQKEENLFKILGEYDGNDSVTIYCENEKSIKKLPRSRNTKANNELINRLKGVYSDENVRIAEKSIEKMRKMD